MTSEMDEMLMAYADGELNEEARCAVERILESNPKARRELEIYQQSANWLKSEMEAVEKLPIPERLTIASPDVIKTPGITRMNRWRSQRRPHYRGLGTPALAASIALCVGVLLGGLWSSDHDGSLSGSAGQFLTDTLESGASGLTVKDPAGQFAITPLATFESVNSGYCREYEVNTGSGLTFGVACRQAEGGWITGFEVHETVQAGKSSSHYVPAAGLDDLVSGYLDKIGAGAVLPAVDEGRLMQNNWTP